jgi:hypothetical protein
VLKAHHPAFAERSVGTLRPSDRDPESSSEDVASLRVSLGAQKGQAGQDGVPEKDAHAVDVVKDANHRDEKSTIPSAF